jgi:hypothetical protein
MADDDRLDIPAFHIGGYWDIDAILAEETCVPAKTLVTCDGLGWLVGGAGASNADLPVGEKVEMPLWLAVPYALQSYVDVGYPDFLHTGVREMLTLKQEYAEVADLGSKSPFFYDVGVLLTKLRAYLEESNSKDEMSEHEKFMQDLLVGKTTRFGATLKRTIHPNGSVDPQMYIRRLTRCEEDIFELARSSMLDFERWFAARDVAEVSVGIKRRRLC